MNIQFKYLAIGALVMMIVGAGIERKWDHSGQEVVKTTTQEHQVEKEVDQQHKQATIVIHDVKNKDGSEEITTTKTVDTTENETKNTTTDVKTKTTDTKASKAKNYYLFVNATVDLNQGPAAMLSPYYGVGVGKQLVGPLGAEVQVDTKSSLTGSLVYSF